MLYSLTFSSKARENGFRTDIDDYVNETSYLIGSVKMNNLPNRPRFLWDSKSVPWTYEKGDKEDYWKSVKLWCASFNSLQYSNRMIISASLRGICFKSQLYGRAKESMIRI